MSNTEHGTSSGQVAMGLLGRTVLPIRSFFDLDASLIAWCTTSRVADSNAHRGEFRIGASELLLIYLW